MGDIGDMGWDRLVNILWFIFVECKGEINVFVARLRGDAEEGGKGVYLR